LLSFRFGRLLLLRSRGIEQCVNLLFELFEFNLDLVDGVPGVLVELLSRENLIHNIEERAYLSDFSKNILAVLLGNSSSSNLGEFIIDFLDKILQLLLIYREVISEVKSGLNREGKLLKLFQSLLVSSSRGSLALTIDPVDSLLEALHKGNAGGFINEFFHRSVRIDIVLDLIGERLKLVLDGFEIEDVIILCEPLLL
jgi:hypothetical protein